ncbi:MAG TPA: diacylglycerol kinase family protein [Planctomycetota bacterium]|nr:diacylglycerol kinase family protein [Planctomycetota bacterium]
MRRALVIVNPIAGRGKGSDRLGRVEQELRRVGIAAETVVTSQPGDARGAAAKAQAHDLVAVIGGDGTLNEVLNGLDADRPVALLPLGTGNVLAKELRLPRRVGRFCDMLARGRERLLDLGAVEGRRFVSMVGAGFDAEVAARLASERTGGIRMRRYAGLILRCLARYGTPRIAVSVDGAPPVEAQGFALVSNVRSYGGPFCITPHATPHDGWLDVCVLPRGGLGRYVRAMLALLLRCPGLSGTRYLRGRSVRLTSTEAVRYQVDGDPGGLLPATVELLDRKLRFIVP